MAADHKHAGRAEEFPRPIGYEVATAPPSLIDTDEPVTRLP